jgi:hypothetical protein
MVDQELCLCFVSKDTEGHLLPHHLLNVLKVCTDVTVTNIENAWSFCVEFPSIEMVSMCTYMYVHIHLKTDSSIAAKKEEMEKLRLVEQLQPNFMMNFMSITAVYDELYLQNQI